MARGMVVGEQIVSQAATEEFRENHERIFGDKKPQRGRWVWDARLGKLVPFDEYHPEPEAVNAPIMSGRCFENQVAPDGTDIGSRAKLKQWMRETGNADYDDFAGAREKRAKEEAAKKRGEFKTDKALREQIGRELYKRKMIL
jgi:hypothetical protein